MYIYTTPQFDRQAKQQGIQANVAQLLVNVRQQGITAVYSLFEWNYPYLKRPIKNNLRLVGRVVKLNSPGDDVLCLLAVFTRGGKEYEAFLRNPEQYGQKHLDSQINWVQLETNIQTQWQEQHSLPPRLSLPHQLYHLWLDRPTWARNSNDTVICESEVWVSQFKQSETQVQWRSYYDILAYLVEGNQQQNGIVRRSTPLQNIELCGKPNEQRYILYSQLETADYPPRNVLFLLSLFSHLPSETEINQITQLTHLLNYHQNSVFVNQPPTFDHLSRYTRRYYPDYLIADSEIWLELERDTGINLALSVEEEEILHELSTAEWNNHSLPVFINGRAGSGKSTMLIYLFADYCDRYQKYYLQQNSNDPVYYPLFLTYNERLLAKAKEGVEKLLKNHHKFLIETNGNIRNSDLDNCFQSFNKFLLSQLPTHALNHFDSDYYLSFNEFRKHFKRRFNRYSPELCWHIIRTFIKGYSLKDHQDEYMTPEDYEEVPRRERTISLEIFKAIYKQVWPWYHQLTSREGYWDDQDLIRKVLELKCYKAQYTAIFCDEAQDFTKLELQLIMKISVFSQCELRPPLMSLPFAFAGDPFQTLNPTGFRWESAKAAFFDQVIAALDPTRQLNLNMTFYELESNYRSSPAIVKFTNLIHLWRQVLFNIPELKPQEAWQSYQTSNPPQKFIFDRYTFSAEALKNHLQKSPIFIVPCEAGGELNYIKNDPFLAPLFPDVSEINPPKNVLSAIQAKGLEFPLIILYKFGDKFAQKFQKSILDYAQTQVEHSLELEYFFNKLYVAASRGMSDLIIIDTNIGDKFLWQYATISESNSVEEWLEKTDKRMNWEGYVDGIRWGNNLVELEGDNREFQAKELEDNGYSQNDSISLRQAKQFYTELGQIDKAQLCEAWALKFDKQFHQAGILFLQYQQEIEAWNCFWQGLCWQALVAWYRQFPRKKTIEYSVVRFMVNSDKTVAKIKEFTLFLEDNLGSLILLENRLVKAWKVTIQEYNNQIRRLLKEKQLLEPQDWQQVGDVLEGLDEAKYSGMLSVAGDCFYRAKNLKRAVNCWQNSGQTHTREYNLAKAELLGIPEGLPYLEKAKADDKIISEWENAGKPGTQQWLKFIDYIGQALQRQHRYQDWAEYLIQIKRWKQIILAIEKCSKPEQNILKIELVRQLSRSNITSEQLREVRYSYVVLMEQVLKIPNLKQYLSVAEIGIAFEKIGELVPTLRFYERFIHHQRHPRLCQWTRQRWLATKLKQQEYALVAEPKRAEIIRQEILKRSYDWAIPGSEVPLDPPRLYDENATVDTILNRANFQSINSPVTDLEITGLPANIKVKSLSKEIGAYSFRIAALEIKRVKKEQTLWLLIRDTVTSREVQVKVENKIASVKVGDIKIEATDGKQLSFESPTREYRGVIFYQTQPPRVELSVRGLSNKICL
ncbi:MAG: UvrD-helicase domain-containing protein [Microcoleaceae cyanobacterium]